MEAPLRTDESIKSIRINGKKLYVRIADTIEEREQGLMGITKIEGYDGMLFIFRNDGDVSFWNKETHLDLDLVWIKDKQVLGVDFLPRETGGGLKIVPSPGAVDMVLELPSGRAEDFSIISGALVSLPPELELK